MSNITSPGAISRSHILVIDDERKLGQMVKRRLERTGRYTVKLACSGSEGLRLARTLRFDAVLTDVRMPGLDGATVLDTLKREQPETPVILFSVYHDESSVITPELLGKSDGLVAKPIVPDQMTHAIEEALRRRAGR